ncbi:MAG: DUF3617 family protein [Caulobacter sp.]
MRRIAPVVRTLVLAGLVGLAPNACSDKPDRSNPRQPGRVVTPQELPRLRPGLWRTTTRTDNHPPETLVQCIGQDHSLAQSMGEARLRCPGLAMTSHRGAYVVTARCARDGGETLRRARFTGDFRSRMRAEMALSLLAPDRSPRVMTLVSEGRHEGPCPPGQEPGLVEDAASRR